MLTSDWTTTPITADLVRGALDLERTPAGVMPHRLPAWARKNADAQLAMAESHASGVRVSFRTTATAVELDVLATHHLYPGTPPRRGNLYDLRVDGHLVDQRSVDGGNTVVTDLTTGTSEYHAGTISTLRFAELPPGTKCIEIWLPYRETIELVALRSDAPVAPSTTGRRPRWLHHGSSISHGSDASSASTTWAALAAAAGDVELTNLGLSGSALLDPFIARVMRDVPAELISMKIGINLVNGDLMRLRAFTPAVHGFLDTIREGHPETPTLVISPLLCPIHEQTPGPAAFDPAALATGNIRFVATGDPTEAANGKLTLETIRAELARIVDQRRSLGDTNLHYLDGRSLYGEPDTEAHPLADQLHPDHATHQLIGQRFAKEVFSDVGPFGPSERGR